MVHLRSFFLAIVIFAFAPGSGLLAQDWPVYKGNLYLTGNNDEIIVKTGYLKWIFNAKNNIYNPVVSDGKIYFLDKKFNVFCINEDTGEFIWKASLIEISREFTGVSRSPGKIKYPVIKDNFLIITDATMIYALNKNTGKVIWSRTAMSDELHPENVNRMTIDGIYSDPTIHGDEILYGTRNVFMARKVVNGHLTWNRSDIKSYSGFPVYYDKYIFTQSMDFSTGTFTVYCLDLETGKELWKKNIAKPLKIFSPVVNRNKVYFPSGSKIFVLDLITGKLLWEKDYKEYITSDLSFTSREIFFSLNNKDIISVNPEDGSIQNRISFNEKGNPWFVLTRDQVYVAKTGHENDQKTAYTNVTAFSRDNFSVPLWNFRSAFPGAAAQPVSSGGILFVPGGNYLYAIGDRLKTDLKKKDNDYYIDKIDEKGNKSSEKAIREETEKNPEPENEKTNTQNHPYKNKKAVKVITNDENNQLVDAEVEVIQRDNGKIISRKKHRLNNKDRMIEVPEPDSGSKTVELIIDSVDRIPQKIVLNKDDKEVKTVLEKIKAGKSFNVENIEFEINKDYLKNESLEILQKLANILKKNPRLKVEIIGHTDSSGEIAYNQALSERRAESVSDFLIKQGISPLRLKTKGMGEKQPVASNETIEGRRKNRRTEFFLSN